MGWKRRIRISSFILARKFYLCSPLLSGGITAGHHDGGRNWARFASLIGTCKMNGVEPYAYLHDLFISIANGHPAKDIDALMPWAYVLHAKDA